MGSDVLVSVIVPVFGVEKYLPRCLDSLLVQDMENVEFLLIDDGSRDRCGEILDDKNRAPDIRVILPRIRCLKLTMCCF
ncbi:MAG: glycosyltransferase family 2 protein [Clostridiales bacterium]|nr:glycosyltransferase family 2 protein [Clostridiales bacterium]